MFDIGFSEIVVIGVVALVVIGPERLPNEGAREPVAQPSAAQAADQSVQGETKTNEESAASRQATLPGIERI